ncbi:NAD-dependent deacylase [Actinoplanes sp. NPDC051470]|uniref:SIR2 family NAD-dependent protein deacylase n=1 Tax=Actinoplanes sp. NPDC051470 TaxID=3157224 RepID=UPI003432E40B
MDETLREAADLVATAERVVIFTGAGISAESGVPTFREALTGLWERFDAAKLATPEAFDEDPALVWGWYEWRRALALTVAPNPGHIAATEILADAGHATLITQNVDDLHERAGATGVLHLHGSLFTPRCSACARPAALSPAPDGEPGRITPPPCDRCGAPIRPGVVWFGEALPTDGLEAAVEAAANADVLISVGTSGLVYPAAEIPQVTARMGGAVIQVNPEPTPLDPVARVNLRGPSAEILPALLRQSRPST